MDKEFLNKWAKTTKKPLKELEKKFDEIVMEVDRLHADKSDLERERIAKVLFRKQMGRDLYSRAKPDTYFGFIFGTTRAFDINENYRRKALARSREDPVQAQLEGLIDEQGVPLDPREKIGTRDNPGYHKPLTEHLWTRKVYGIAQKEGTKGPLIFVMSLWRASAKNFTYKPFVPIEFKAITKDMKKGYYVLNPCRDTKFQVTRKEVDFEKWIRDASKVVPLADLKKIAEQHTREFDYFVITEADVDLIRPEVNANTNSRSIILSDADSGMIETVRVFLSADYPIGFSELSRVLVLGKPRLWKRNDEDEEQVSMEAFGIYPLPGKTVTGIEAPTEEVPTNGSDEEGPIVEFVEEPEK
jgi:hypothetical protein